MRCEFFNRFKIVSSVNIVSTKAHVEKMQYKNQFHIEILKYQQQQQKKEI